MRPHIYSHLVSIEIYIQKKNISKIKNKNENFNLYVIHFLYGMHRCRRNSDLKNLQKGKCEWIG